MQAPPAARNPAATAIARPGLAARLVRRWWWREIVGALDRPHVVAGVEAEAGWSRRYAFMTLMSAGIAVLGLLLSSPAVVIGAMLISPLMGPIIGLGFAFAIFDWREVRRSLLALIVGSAIAVMFCAAIVSLSPLTAVTPEILARTRPNLFDLLVAVFSALAGVYATIRGRGGTIVGVAIATALMPPLAVVGFGLATANLTVFWGAAELYATNFIAIALSAAVMARLYGFGQDLSPRHTHAQALLILIVMAALAVPLGFALRQIAWEARASALVRATLNQHFGPEARVSQLELDFGAEPLAARAVVLTPRYRADSGAVVRAAAAAIGRPLTLRLNQVVVDQDLSRLRREQAALAEASRVSQTAPDDGSARELARELAVITGTPAEAVLIDRDARRATATPRASPAFGLDAWRLLEAGVAARRPGWRIAIVPPAGAPLGVPFARDSAERSAAVTRAAATIAWALARWNATAVDVIGRAASNERQPRALARARADAVAALLAERGISATATVDPVGPRQRGLEREAGRAVFRAVEVRITDPANGAVPVSSGALVVTRTGVQ